MAKPQPEQTIEDTLRLMHIDTDASAEDAAAAAGERVARSGGGGVADDERVLIPSPDDGDEDDDFEEDGEDVAPSTRRNAASRMDEPTPSLIPAPKQPKAQARFRSPVAGKMGKGLADKAPGAEKVKVYKRELGGRWFVQDYTRADLSNFPDFESFITRYVKPDHGPGEYDLVGVDALNREIELGTVRLIATKTPTAEAGVTGLISEMMRQQSERDKEYLNRMNMMQQQPAQKDPIELLTGMMNLKKQMEADASGEAQVLAQASKVAASETLQMMMLMMQQQSAAADRQNQLMMTLLARPKEEDPVLKLLMTKLLEDKGSSGGGGSPPPPPPSSAPAEQPNMVDMLKGLSEVMANLAPSGGGDDEFKEFMKQMMLKNENEKLSIKDIIALTKGDPDKPGTDDFRRSIDNMAAIMNVAQSLNKGQEAGPSAGFFDALGSLFGNRDFAGSLANTIRTKMDQSANAQAQQLAAERQRLEMVQRNILREKAQLQQLQLSSGHPAVAAPGGVITVPAPVQVVQPTAVAAVAPSSEATAPLVTVNPTPEQVQKAVERTIERQGKIPQLPAQTHEHISRIAAAADDADLVARTVELLIYFAESDDWRGFSEQLLGFVRAGDKRSTLQYLRTFFTALTELQMMAPELAQRIFTAVTQNLDALQTQLMDFKLTGDDLVTAEDLLATPG